jgi:hypothetical protein
LAGNRKRKKVKNTKTACTLHNFVRRRDGYNFEDTLSCEMEGVRVCSSTGSSLQTRDIRDRFANYFVSPQGELEWQYEEYSSISVRWNTKYIDY